MCLKKLSSLWGTTKPMRRTKEIREFSESYCFRQIQNNFKKIERCLLTCDLFRNMCYFCMWCVLDGWNKGWSAVVNIGFCVKIGFVNIGSIRWLWGVIFFSFSRFLFSLFRTIYPLSFKRKREIPKGEFFSPLNFLFSFFKKKQKQKMESQKGNFFLHLKFSLFLL